MTLSRNTKWLLWLGGLSILLVFVIVISSGLGVARISPSRILRIVSSRIPFVNLQKRLLLSVDLEFRSDLDRDNISEELRQELEKNGISLSRNATVSIEEQESKWLIADEDKTYTISKEGDRLSVYERIWSDTDELILMEWRLPRIFIACIVGAGLALAGVVFQALLRNPLAEPYILGVSSGGSLGAIIAIILGISSIKGLSTLPFFAFLGALSTMFLVYSISRIGGRVPTHTLLLAGVIVNAFFSAIIMFLVSMVRADETHKFLLWSMGNLTPTETRLTVMAMSLIVLGGLALYYHAQAFNLFSLGEESAAQLGVEVERVKKIAFVLASLITGAAVSACGIIGFVGLIVPHMVRMTIGADHRILMPASVLAGASFLTAADTVARVITAPAEIPVGVVTAICGGPFFIYLLRRKRASFVR